MRWTLYILLAIVGFAFAIWLAAGGARAHEWYPVECCSGLDCAEIMSSRVAMTPAGYLIDRHFTVPYAKAKSSPDGKYHACFPTPDNLRCFFAPPMGF